MSAYPRSQNDILMLWCQHIITEFSPAAFNRAPIKAKLIAGSRVPGANRRDKSGIASLLPLVDAPANPRFLRVRCGDLRLRSGIPIPIRRRSAADSR
jgi:hypothetical protein